MLLQTAYSPLPNKTSCNNGSILFGAAVSAMSSNLTQLSHVKFLGMSNYSVMRSTYNRYTTVNNTGSIIAEGVGDISKGHTENHRFFYASTSITNWVGVVLAYESGSSSSDGTTASFSPVINVSIKALTGTPLAEGSTIDHGIRLDSSNSLLLASEEISNFARSYVYYAESSIEIPASAPTNTSPVAPRPLFIPSANRGEIVSINVSCEDCKLRHFTTFDLYQPEQST